LNNIDDTEISVWLSRNVLPHEKDLRSWLRQFHNVDVGDIIQETYAILLTAETTHIRNPRAYFFQTARNVALQYYRKARVVSIIALANIETMNIKDDAPSPERAVNASDQLGHLHRLVDALPRQCREILLLRRLEGLSQRQVSQYLGVSENVVEKQIARAIRHLSVIFAGDEEPTTPAKVAHDADLEAVARER